MMEELRRLGSAEKPCQLDLAAGRVEQILAANHNRHALQPVVDDDRKLIGPVSMAIADEEVAALFGRSLLLRAETKIQKRSNVGASRTRRPSPAPSARRLSAQVPGYRCVPALVLEHLQA